MEVNLPSLEIKIRSRVLASIDACAAFYCVVQLKTLVFDNLSEWLRRKARNLLGSARAGSNPAVVDTPIFLSP